MLNVLLDQNLIKYPLIREPPKIKPPRSYDHLFYNFHGRAGNSIKYCNHLKNFIEDLHDQVKLKFDHKVQGLVSKQEKGNSIQQDGLVHPQNKKLKIFSNPFL